MMVNFGFRTALLLTELGCKVVDQSEFNSLKPDIKWIRPVPPMQVKPLT